MSSITSRSRPHPGPQARPLPERPGRAQTDVEHDPDDWPDPGSGTAPAWPPGPLDAAQRAFDLLVRPPAPLAFDCRGLRGLPQKIVALDELKHLLIAESTPRATGDQVWSQLLTRARRDGPAWVLAAVGIALPALRFRAGLLTRGWHGDIDDLDSELLTGFLERLTTIDLDAANIAARLVEAGARAVKRARKHSASTEPVPTNAPRSFPPARPWDHPDLVLARAVAAGVIGPEEGTLIGATRLEDIPLQKVAEHLGLSTATATAWRYRAEHDLRDAIQAGELQWVDLSSQP
jgi:hypothetical protein